jgi:hypothetical protein
VTEEIGVEKIEDEEEEMREKRDMLNREKFIF